MKRLLHIIGLLCFILLLNPEGGFSKADTTALPAQSCEVTENDPAQQQREMHFVLSSELKNSQGLTPRTTQVNTSLLIQRVSKSLSKQLNQLRLKEYNSQRKTWEFVSSCQTIHYSSLLAGLGYQVFAFRKLLI